MKLKQLIFLQSINIAKFHPIIEINNSLFFHALNGKTANFIYVNGAN